MPRDTIQVRSNPDLKSKLTQLAERWGGVDPLPVSRVIAVAIDRAHAAEFGGEKLRKRGPKKPSDVS